MLTPYRRYRNPVRKRLAVLGIASAVVSLLPYLLIDPEAFLTLISPSLQLVAAYCYMTAIKGMCRQYWKLTTSGITMKEMMSRMQAAGTYRIQNWQRELTTKEKWRNVYRLVIRRSQIPSNIPRVI
jgi:hypothetical protein